MDANTATVVSCVHTGYSICALAENSFGKGYQAYYYTTVEPAKTHSEKQTTTTQWTNPMPQLLFL